MHAAVTQLVQHCQDRPHSMALREMARMGRAAGRWFIRFHPALRMRGCHGLSVSERPFVARLPEQAQHFGRMALEVVLDTTTGRAACSR